MTRILAQVVILVASVLAAAVARAGQPGAIIGTWTGSRLAALGDRYRRDDRLGAHDERFATPGAARLAAAR